MLMEVFIGITSQISVAAQRAQVAWIEKVQERLRATTSLLGDIKAIKMLALPHVVSQLLNNLRRHEIKTSKKFRELLVATLMLCMCSKTLIRRRILTHNSSPHTLEHRSRCDLCSLCCRSRLLDPRVVLHSPSLYLPGIDRPTDRSHDSFHPGPAPGCAMRRQLQPHPRILQLRRC